MLLKHIKRPIEFLYQKKNSSIQLVLVVPHEAENILGNNWIACNFPFYVIFGSNIELRN